MKPSLPSSPPPPPPTRLGDKRQVAKRMKKQQKHASKNEPPVDATRTVLDNGDDVTLTPPERTVTVTASSEQKRKQNDVQQKQQQQRQQQQQQQHASISSTVDVDGRRHDMSEAAAAAVTAVTAVTVAPGEAESIATITRLAGATATQLVTETTSRQQEQAMVSAQLVDENEMQRHAELIFQQMLAQTAVVAEVVNEEEMRRQAHEQAAMEIQQQQQLKDQETVTQDHVSVNKNNKQRQQRLRIIAGGFFFMGAIIAIVVVVVTAVLLQQRGGGDDYAADPSSSLLRSITPSAIPSFSPSTIPSRSFSPSTAPWRSSWQQIGNSINGNEEFEWFGSDLGFSADGNTVVATASNVNGTHTTAQVRAYSYYNETDEWKQLGQFITHDSVYSEYCLSPNGKYMGVFSYGLTDGPTDDSITCRIFALRDKKMNATTTADDTAVAMFWEQIGPDIVVSPDLSFITLSLTDTLILALGLNNYTTNLDYYETTVQGMVHTYQFDVNQSGWVHLGQEIQMESSLSSMQLVLNKSTGTLILAVGGSPSVRTFRYEPDTDSWIQFGSELAADDDEDSFGVLISLSMDGETITFGGQMWGRVIMPHLRTFSYDAATDDWIQLGTDLQDSSSFLFGQSFSLSANGKVLVATTQKVEIVLQGWMSSDVYGQVRTWDFIAAGGGGEWIQRGAALEVGTLDSQFGHKIALSADGNRLATSAIWALNEQGVHAGKVRVFEKNNIE